MEIQYGVSDEEWNRRLSTMGKKADALMLLLELDADKWDFRHSWEYWDDWGICPLYDTLMMDTERAHNKSAFSRAARPQK